MGEGPQNGTGNGPGRRRWVRRYTAILAAGVLAGGAAVGATVASASTSQTGADMANSAATPAKAPASYYRIVPGTRTPIKHLVVLFDENESFDHYFGTYPFAANTDGSKFYAKRGTPRVNGLTKKPAQAQPEQLQPRAAHLRAGAHLRPEPWVPA